MKENLTTTPKVEKVINYIPLIENWYYTAADKDNYILYQKNNKPCYEKLSKIPTGEMKDVFDFEGYFPRFISLIESCVTKLNRQSIIEGSITTLNDSVKQITSAYKQIKDIIEL